MNVVLPIDCFTQVLYTPDMFYPDKIFLDFYYVCNINETSLLHCGRKTFRPVRPMIIGCTASKGYVLYMINTKPIGTIVPNNGS